MNDNVPTEIPEESLNEVAGGWYTQNRWDSAICSDITSPVGRCYGAGPKRSTPCDHFRKDGDKGTCVMGRYTNVQY